MKGSELLAFLQKHNISAQALAEILGVTDGAVYHWTNGDREMSKMTSRLIRLFDKHPELMKEFAA